MTDLSPITLMGSWLSYLLEHRKAIQKFTPREIAANNEHARWLHEVRATFFA
jgi:hypothetical protein